MEKLKAISITGEQTGAVPNTEGCYKHNNQPLVFFCETCITAVCRDCTVMDHDKTGEHSIVNFVDAVATQRQTLEAQMKAGLVRRSQVQRDVDQMKHEMEKIHVCRYSVIKNLRSLFQNAHERLEQGEQQIINVIMKQYDAQQSALLDKEDQLHKATTLLDKRISQSTDLMNTWDIREMMHFTEKLKNATEMAKSDPTASGEGLKSLASDIITNATSLNDSLCHVGKNCFKSLLPTKIVLKNNNITAGLETVITIELLNDEAIKVPIAVCFLAINIIDPWESALPVTLATIHPECTMAFTPQRSGRHEISVMYLGQKLMSKQDFISVGSNDPVLKIGGPGNGNGTFNSPRGIAIDNNNCLYVADTGNGLIQKFSANGEFLSQFRVNQVNKTFTAFTVALDLNKGLIICTEILLENNAAVEGNTMLQFNLKGELQNSYTLNDMSCPLIIAINSHGNVLMSDDGETKCVFEVNREGKFVNRVSEFKRPGHICIDDDGIMIISDINEDCVSLLNPDGEVKHKFGSRGTGKGQLQDPFGVATDGENILVAEAGTDRVQVFQYNGTPVCVIESEGDPLCKPRGLAVTDDGHVYVVDRDNHCVKKYKYKNVR